VTLVLPAEPTSGGERGKNPIQISEFNERQGAMDFCGKFQSVTEIQNCGE
jgi:hypothetical protein